MKHDMKLQNEHFVAIKNGTKTIEMRLYDEKRKLVNLGDIIEFTNITTGEKITAQVEHLYLYPSFEELYKNHNKIDLGYKQNEIASPKDMSKYYPQEEQEKFGVVGIKIKLI